MSHFLRSLGAVAPAFLILGSPWAREAAADPTPAAAPAAVPAPAPVVAQAGDEVVPASAEPVPVEAAVPAAPEAPLAPAPAEAASDVAAAPVAVVTAARPWTERLSIGGGAILWYYQPFTDGVDNDFSLYFANLVLDGKVGGIGLHIEPRLRATKLRPFFDGPVWVEEAYVHGKVGPATVKVGKVYSRLGLFWDGSFYGNVHVYDGLKLAPDYGVSVEAATPGEGKVGVRGWGQFFVVDGSTNVSLPGRDTVSIAGARRRNEVVARAEPYLKLDRGEVAVGLSGQFLQADLPSFADAENVYRGAVDAKVTYPGAGAWAEVLYQDGRHVDGFPVAPTPSTPDAPAMPGVASGQNLYVLAGAEYTYGPVTGRYNVSHGRYDDVDVTETLHEPAIAYAAGDNLSLLAELVLWNRSTPAGDVRVDRSLNVTLHGHF
jgi:hypothetical protein